mgnify:CR=1 FL=1
MHGVLGSGRNIQFAAGAPLFDFSFPQFFLVENTLRPATAGSSNF